MTTSMFQFIANAVAKFNAMAREANYRPISTFYQDLAIAEWFELYGKDKGAIEDTFNTVCRDWLSDYKMFTEFVLCLNWKIWEYYEEDEKIAKLYDSLWQKADNLFMDKYEDNEKAMKYYFRVLD